mgnify:CR=1 FL=1
MSDLVGLKSVEVLSALDSISHLFGVVNFVL